MNNVAPALIALNQAYLIGAAEICRQDPQQAAVLLHLDPADVARLAETTSADVVRLSDVPVALVHPLPCMTSVLGSTTITDLLAPTQAAMERASGEGQ